MTRPSLFRRPEQTPSLDVPLNVAQEAHGPQVAPAVRLKARRPLILCPPQVRPTEGAEIVSSVRKVASVPELMEGSDLFNAGVSHGTASVEHTRREAGTLQTPPSLKGPWGTA